MTSILESCLDEIDRRFAAAAGAHAKMKAQAPPRCMVAFDVSDEGDGEVYAAFHGDARLASMILGIDLSPDFPAQPTCVFGREDLTRLTDAGERVAVCLPLRR